MGIHSDRLPSQAHRQRGELATRSGSPRFRETGRPDRFTSMCKKKSNPYQDTRGARVQRVRLCVAHRQDRRRVFLRSSGKRFLQRIPGTPYESRQVYARMEYCVPRFASWSPLPRHPPEEPGTGSVSIASCGEKRCLSQIVLRAAEASHSEPAARSSLSPFLLALGPCVPNRSSLPRVFPGARGRNRRRPSPPCWSRPNRRRTARLGRRAPLPRMPRRPP